jgi:hypothetical protein
LTIFSKKIPIHCPTIEIYGTYDADEETMPWYCCVFKDFKNSDFPTCVKLGRIRIRIGIILKSRIRIRI